MVPQRVPFQDIGIEQNVGERVVRSIDSFLSKCPNRPIDIRTVSDAVGVSGTTVKRVFYALLTLRLLKATFIPRHRTCGYQVGGQERSVEVIWKKAKSEEYWCVHCAEPIENPSDLEIQIVFWRPGANVESS